MRSRPNGQAGVGATSVVLGALLLVGGVLRPPVLLVDLAGTPLWAMAFAAGIVLCLIGSVTLAVSLRRVDEPEPEVPVHVAFAFCMVIPDVVPSLATPTAASAPAAGARLPAPAPSPQRRVPFLRPDLAKIDVEIRELTRKINKAGVMLATGQLSQQGYLAYVEDLKRQRGALEAQRVRAEIS